MNATEPLINSFQAKVDGFLTTADVRRIRKRLNLSQQKASEIFGGGHNAFSRYERGVIRHSKSLDYLLRLLDKHPEFLDELIELEAA